MSMSGSAIDSVTILRSIGVPVIELLYNTSISPVFKTNGTSFLHSPSNTGILTTGSPL